MEIRCEEDDRIKQLYEASMTGDVPTLIELLKKHPLLLYEISVTPVDKTLLHISALLGHLDFTIALLTYKRKLATELDFHNRSALHLASAEGHIEIVKELLDVNTDVCLTADEEGRIPLHYAAMRGRTKVIHLLIKVRPGSIRVKADREKTVLHLCVLYNHLEALKLLVEYVNDDFEFLNSKDHDGHTILHLAAMLKQVETTKYLLSRRGLEENVKNGIGFTALEVIEHCSRDYKSHEIPNLLDAIEQLIQKKKKDFSSDSKSLEIQKLLMNQNDQSRLQLGIQWLKFKRTKWIGSLGYSADWSKNTRDALMVVSTVITSTTFQCAINPPGGVWQDFKYLETYRTTNRTIFHYVEPDSTANAPIFHYLDPNRTKPPIFLEAGTAVLPYLYPEKYSDFFVKNTISFIASLCVIILLVSGVPLSNKFWSWLLTIFMTLTLIFMGLAYQGAMWLVTPNVIIDKVDLYNNRSLKVMISCLGIFAGFNTLRFAASVIMNLRNKCKKAPTGPGITRTLSHPPQVQMSEIA